MNNLNKVISQIAQLILMWAVLINFSSCTQEEEIYIPEEVCTCNLILSVDSVETEARDHNFYNWDILDNNTNTTAQDGYINYAFPNEDDLFFIYGFRIYVTVQNIHTGEVSTSYIVKKVHSQHTENYYLWELDVLEGMRLDGTLTLEHLNEYPKARESENYESCHANRLHDERIIQYQLDNQ